VHVVVALVAGVPVHVVDVVDVVTVLDGLAAAPLAMDVRVLGRPETGGRSDERGQTGQGVFPWPHHAERYSPPPQPS
jgi:hypothetical protein